LLLAGFAVGPASANPSKHPPRFVPPDILTAGDVPYPINSIAAGVVTLAVNLSSAGHVTGVQTVRDLPGVTSLATGAVQTWTYSPATLNGKPVASTLIVNVVFCSGFLPSDNIPLAPPAQFQPASPSAAAFAPPQLVSATFAPYPPNSIGVGAVVLDVTIDSTGNVAGVATIRDVPSLTASALGALRNWSFSQATFKDNAIASHMVVAFVFRSPSTSP
jgi:outer membrane biosynthesis protein TonB